jgi:LPS sulfotransferase NodH
MTAVPTLRRSVTRFVLLFPGRSGSTYLISALDAHPAITAKGEVLDPIRPQGPEAQLDWTRRYFRGPVVNRSKAVGFKTKLRDVLDQDGFARLLEEFDARLIYLDRRNDVKHAISRITARRLKDSTGRWNRYDGDATLEAFDVDLDDFAERLTAVEEEKATIAEYVGAVDRPLLHLDYEDLLAEPDPTFHRVLAFLGLPPAPIRGNTLKNTSDDLRDVVANFDALRARYAGTRYEPMFDEVLVP